MLKVACSGPGVSRTRNLLVMSPILYQLDHCTQQVAKNCENCEFLVKIFPKRQIPRSIFFTKLMAGKGVPGPSSRQFLSCHSYVAYSPKIAEIGNFWYKFAIGSMVQLACRHTQSPQSATPSPRSRTRNREVAGSTHTRSTASNLKQVANLLRARANSASYPQRDGK